MILRLRRPAIGRGHRPIEETTLPRSTTRKVRAPRWTRWCVALGSLLFVAGGGSAVGVRVLVNTATQQVTQKNLLGTVRSGAEREHADVTGAKNIILVGLDTRPNQDPGQLTRSDSIIILHIPRKHTQGYLISLPRDSFVEIPEYDNGKVRWAGGKSKINAAFAFGSRGLTGDAALQHGFELLALTVKRLTGITPDAGAIIDFQGFKKVVNVLGKVCMYVDETTTSIHYGHDKSGKLTAPFKINPDGTLRAKIPGVNPNVYAKGDRCFTPGEALDFVRQRDLLANKDYDYGRQRHQQQFIKAVLKQTVKDGLNSPTKLPGLLKAVGETMTVDSGGISLDDWAFAMRDLNPDDLVTVKTNDGTFNSRSIPGIGSVEVLSETSLRMLRAVRNDDIESFLVAHPETISAS
jgi:anionic cell wall polymer biosynthesis LytR-Cps2A-Psr (LCP) family protein